MSDSTGCNCIYGRCEQVKHQKAEIERLNVEIAGLRGLTEQYAQEAQTALIENERVVHHNSDLAALGSRFKDRIAELEAVLEAAELCLDIGMSEHSSSRDTLKGRIKAAQHGESDD